MPNIFIETNDHFEFHLEDTIPAFDNYNLWSELILESIKLLRLVITEEHKESLGSWKIRHRSYDINNPLDYNYVRFESKDASFEVFRDCDNGIYSTPLIQFVEK